VSEKPPQLLNEAMQRYLQTVWRRDVRPLLSGSRAEQRETAARVGGAVAGTGGLFIDKLLGLRGRPFARAMTVLGSSLGAMLPDAWDWQWLGKKADARQAEAVREAVERAGAELPEQDALELLGLTPRSTAEEMRAAWRGVSQRWHPDKAADEAQRREFTLRFQVYRQAVERLRDAYEAGRLPIEESRP